MKPDLRVDVCKSHVDVAHRAAGRQRPLCAIVPKGRMTERFDVLLGELIAERPEILLHYSFVEACKREFGVDIFQRSDVDSVDVKEVTCASNPNRTLEAIYEAGSMCAA